MKKLILITFLSSFALGQSLFEKAIIKAIVTFEPSMKKANERLNESNGERAVFTYHDLDGKAHSIDEYLGQVVLVDMWATWCSPCVKQIPDLNILQEKYRNDGLVILSITDEDPATVKTFLTKHEMNEKVGFIKYDDVIAEPFRHFRRGRPLYFLMDKKGIVQSGSMFKPSDRKIKKYLRQ